jgi:hypothetical protein
MHKVVYGTIYRGTGWKQPVLRRFGVGPPTDWNVNRFIIIPKFGIGLLYELGV